VAILDSGNMDSREARSLVDISLGHLLLFTPGLQLFVSDHPNLRANSYAADS
jgi:hypothetical protein